MEMAKSVEEYLDKNPNWFSELSLLREIFLETEMVEEVKWGMPTYTINKKKVVGIAGFKEYFGIWFFQGVFLEDPLKVLVNAQEGKTRGMRHWKFSDIKEVKKDLILPYVEEAIQNCKEGKEIKIEKKALIIPSLLQDALDSDSALKAAFNNFTHGKKREFAEHISEAKREATKISRLQKIIPMIINGIGLNDKYRSS